MDIAHRAALADKIYAAHRERFRDLLTALRTSIAGNSQYPSVKVEVFEDELPLPLHGSFWVHGNQIQLTFAYADPDLEGSGILTAAITAAGKPSVLCTWIFDELGNV